MASKTSCPVTRSQFTAHAKPVTTVLNGQTLTVSPKRFSTGSFGWYTSDKATIIVDGVPCKVQVNLTLTVVGSKDLPQDASVPGSDEYIAKATSTPEVQALREKYRAIEASKADSSTPAA